jgi:peptidoglycan/LPS O-acetylase OafA/YrhL
MEVQSKNRYLFLLQIFRGFAAFMVVVHHAIRLVICYYIIFEEKYMNFIKSKIIG